jgi:hypothetical protein
MPPGHPCPTPQTITISKSLMKSLQLRVRNKKSRIDPVVPSRKKNSLEHFDSAFLFKRGFEDMLRAGLGSFFYLVPGRCAGSTYFDFGKTPLRPIQYRWTAKCTMIRIAIPLRNQIFKRLKIFYLHLQVSRERGFSGAMASPVVLSVLTKELPHGH